MQEEVESNERLSSELEEVNRKLATEANDTDNLENTIDELQEALKAQTEEFVKVEDDYEALKQ